MGVPRFLGASLNASVEGNPRNKIEDITWNARPYFSLTPVNDLNVRVYVDNVYVRSTERVGVTKPKYRYCF